jgi:hypothetical protein
MLTFNKFINTNKPIMGIKANNALIGFAELYFSILFKISSVA